MACASNAAAEPGPSVAHDRVVAAEALGDGDLERHDAAARRPRLVPGETSLLGPQRVHPEGALGVAARAQSFVRQPAESVADFHAPGPLGLFARLRLLVVHHDEAGHVATVERSEVVPDLGRLDATVGTDDVENGVGFPDGGQRGTFVLGSSVRAGEVPGTWNSRQS